MLRVVIPLLLLVSSCSSPKTVITRVGAGRTVGISDSIPILTRGEDIHVSSFEALWGCEIYESKIVSIDSHIGPEVSFLDNGGPGVGVGTQLRFRFGKWVAQPYILMGAGVDYFSEKVGIQGTNFGFILQGGPGIRFQVSENLYLDANYRLWHESNGSAIFGSKEPNPGYNADMIFIGVEIKL